jgi:hypothetical protein
LAAPKVTRKDLEEPEWVGDADLVEEVPDLPAWPSKPAGTGTGDDDQEFLIDLD